MSNFIQNVYALTTWDSAISEDFFLASRFMSIIKLKSQNEWYEPQKIKIPSKKSLEAIIANNM